MRYRLQIPSSLGTSSKSESSTSLSHTNGTSGIFNGSVTLSVDIGCVCPVDSIWRVAYISIAVTINGAISTPLFKSAVYMLNSHLARAIALHPLEC